MSLPLIFQRFGGGENEGGDESFPKGGRVLADFADEEGCRTERGASDCRGAVGAGLLVDGAETILDFGV